MSIEQTLQSIDASLKTLVQIAQTLGSGTAQIANAATADTKTKETKTSKADKPAATESKPAGPTFKEVTEKVTALSKMDGGRDKVRKLIDSFKPGTAEKPTKFPELEALNKNAEILAAIEEAMKPAEAPAAEDDGLGL